MNDKPKCVEYPDGTRRWFINGKFHREDGPAVEYTNGTKRWYINNKLHREDGPAYEGTDGTKRWYINNIELTPYEIQCLHFKQGKCAYFNKAGELVIER